MIITITGLPGSGKSTLARNLARALGFKHYSAGELMRQIASERKMTIIELNKRAEDEEAIDRAVDERTGALAEREDNFVIDSRLAWHFVPKSIKIFVKADLRKVAERIYKDMRRDEKENTSVEKTFENLQLRNRMEIERWKRMYGVNYMNENNYDFIIDTTNISIDETLEKALSFIRRLKD